MDRLVVGVAAGLRWSWIAAIPLTAGGVAVFVLQQRAFAACRDVTCATASADAGPAAFAALLAGLVALGLSGTVARFAAHRLDGWHVRRIGRDASAVVLRVSSGRLVVNHTPLRTLLVAVSPAAGGAPFRTRLQEFGSFSPGDRLAVRYDPARPWRVAATARLADQPAEIRGRTG